jgi:cobalt/nickel transport protein
MRTPLAVAVCCLAGLAPLSRGHFNMLLPSVASAKKGEAVTFTYQWGHPFEHQLFDAPTPERLEAFGPDGKRTDLLPALRKIEVPAAEGKHVTAYQFAFTPEARGDYVFLLQTPPIWMEEDGEFFQDTVKVVLHVQAQKGWDAAGGEFAWQPLTRPYGLRPGTVFQAGLTDGAPPGRPMAGALVEVERYNAAPPGELPPDEQVTRTAKTDPNGVVTCTLAEPGWWCLTASREGGKREREGKAYPVRRRSTLWVFVDGLPAK